MPPHDCLAVFKAPAPSDQPVPFYCSLYANAVAPSIPPAAIAAVCGPIPCAGFLLLLVRDPPLAHAEMTRLVLKVLLTLLYQICPAPAVADGSLA